MRGSAAAMLSRQLGMQRKSVGGRWTDGSCIIIMRGLPSPSGWWRSPLRAFSQADGCVHTKDGTYGAAGVARAFINIISIIIVPLYGGRCFQDILDGWRVG